MGQPVKKEIVVQDNTLETTSKLVLADTLPMVQEEADSGSTKEALISASCFAFGLCAGFFLFIFANSFLGIV